MKAVLESPARCASCGKELAAGETVSCYPGGKVYGATCHGQELLPFPQWDEYQKIAQQFRWRVRPQDRDDFSQEVVLKLAEVSKGRDGLTEKAMAGIAVGVVSAYQRRYEYDFQKDGRRHILLYLSQKLSDEDSRELWEIIADKTAIDLDAWLDAKERLRKIPTKVKDMALKWVEGKDLTKSERNCLSRWRHRDGSPSRPIEWLDQFEVAIRKMLRDGLGGDTILEEMRQKGYQGGRTALYYYLAKLKGTVGEPFAKLCQGSRKPVPDGTGQTFSCPWCGRTLKVHRAFGISRLPPHCPNRRGPYRQSDACLNRQA